MVEAQWLALMPVEQRSELLFDDDGLPPPPLEYDRRMIDAAPRYQPNGRRVPRVKTTSRDPVSIGISAEDGNARTWDVTWSDGALPADPVRANRPRKGKPVPPRARTHELIEWIYDDYMAAKSAAVPPMEWKGASHDYSMRYLRWMGDTWRKHLVYLCMIERDRIDAGREPYIASGNLRRDFLKLLQICGASPEHIERVERRLPQVEREPTILDRVRDNCEKLGIAGPPEWVTDKVVAYVVGRVSYATGGGPRLSMNTLERALWTPKNFAAHVREYAREHAHRVAPERRKHWCSMMHTLADEVLGKRAKKQQWVKLHDAKTDRREEIRDLWDESQSDWVCPPAGRCMVNRHRRGWAVWDPWSELYRCEGYYPMKDGVKVARIETKEDRRRAARRLAVDRMGWPGFDGGTPWTSPAHHVDDFAARMFAKRRHDEEDQEDVEHESPVRRYRRQRAANAIQDRWFAVLGEDEEIFFPAENLPDREKPQDSVRDYIRYSRLGFRLADPRSPSVGGPFFGARK